MFGEVVLQAGYESRLPVYGNSDEKLEKPRRYPSPRKNTKTTRNTQTDRLRDGLIYLVEPLCSPSVLRRRFHSRQSLVSFIFTCLVLIFIYHLFISSVHSFRRRPRGSGAFPKDRYNVDAMHGGPNESTDFTQNLWYFRNNDAERMYLYTKLLAEHKWERNDEYMQLFRQELTKEANVSTAGNLVITQESVKVGEEITTYVDRRSFLDNPFVVNKEFYSSLPKKSPIGGKMYKKCAVVGNSGNILNTSCGTEIDNMDYVFRCNGAPLAPYKNDAGLKTDFITFNPSIIYKHFGGLENDSLVDAYINFMNQYNSIVWYPCFGSYKLLGPCIHAMSFDRIVNPQLVLGHPTHYYNVWEFWKRRGVPKKPSTGLYLMNIAITMCEEVHLYGFWPYPIEMRNGHFQSVNYHYFNHLPFVTNYHNVDMEYRILIQFHMLGLTKIHLGSCAAKDGDHHPHHHHSDDEHGTNSKSDASMSSHKETFDADKAVDDIMKLDDIALLKTL